MTATGSNSVFERTISVSPTPGFEDAWSKEAVYEEAEARRLMYVAATRARDYLIVPVYAPAASLGNYRYLTAVPKWSDAAFAQAPPTISGARVMFDDDLPDGQLSSPTPPDYPYDLPRLWRRRREQQLAVVHTGPRRFLAPSQIVSDSIKLPRETEPPDRSEDERDLDVAGDGDEALAYAGGAAGLLFVGARSARQRGALVHEVLYRCDLRSMDSGQYWAQRLCRERGVPELTGEVTAHVRKVLESDHLYRVTSALQVLRELPVTLFDGQDFTEGYVDLAFEEPGGWVILDYKTDGVRTGVSELTVRYAPQLAAYATVLASAGLHVKQKGLWFTATGDIVFT